MYEKPMYEEQKMMSQTRSASAYCDAPKRDPEIVTEFMRLEKSIESLSDAFSRLGAKLASVTRQEPVGCTEKLGTSAPQTELGNRIRNAAQQIDTLQTLVRQQIDLTEL